MSGASHGFELSILNSSQIPRGKIMQISFAEFRPGQSCPVHKHKDLHEVFICNSGKIDVEVDNEARTLERNGVLIVKPGQNHGLCNKNAELCELLVIGVACPVVEA